MKKGLSRFEFYLSELELLLDKARVQKNPALWLYRNDARTTLFMLEGLAKLYSGLHNKKTFAKLKDHFKLLEDILGAIDYYDVFAKEFAGNKNIPKQVVGYLQSETREKIQSLNDILREEGWLDNDNAKIKKIQKKLAEVKWKKEKKELLSISEFYGKEIYEIVEFTEINKLHFTNIETEVHALRRKLRWLSIYPKALQGCIQFSKTPAMPAHLKKYLSEEIINSKFNKMPDAGDCNYLLFLNEYYFLSLSWMIAELGKLKDNGLRVIAIKEALMQSSKITEDEAVKKAYKFLGKKIPQLPKILETAGSICKTYFGENNLEHLVVGVAKIK